MPDGSRHGPGFVAAVCIRDHWEEMSDDQRDWCVDVVVLGGVASRGRLRTTWSACSATRWRPTAPVPSCWRCCSASRFRTPRLQRVRQAFAAAFTHPVDEVRWYAAWSIDENVWAADRALALRCVNAIATEADLIDKALGGGRERVRTTSAVNAKRSLPKPRRTSARDSGRTAPSPRTRTSRWTSPKAFGADATHAHARHPRTRPERSSRHCRIRSRQQDAGRLVEVGRRSRAIRRDRNFHTESVYHNACRSSCCARRPRPRGEVLAPVLGAIDRHSRELQSIMQGLTGIQDSNPNTPQYWFLWGLFADAVKRAKWVPHLGDEHPDGSETAVRGFPHIVLEGQRSALEVPRRLRASRARALRGAAATSIVLDDYVRFLYHIGERSLPEAFVRVADALRRGEPQKMLEKTNTVFLLEVLLQRLRLRTAAGAEERARASAKRCSSFSTVSSRPDRRQRFA